MGWIADYLREPIRARPEHWNNLLRIKSFVYRHWFWRFMESFSERCWFAWVRNHNTSRSLAKRGERSCCARRKPASHDQREIGVCIQEVPEGVRTTAQCHGRLEISWVHQRNPDHLFPETNRINARVPPSVTSLLHINTLTHARRARFAPAWPAENSKHMT